MEEVRDEVHGVACFMVLHAGVACWSCMEMEVQGVAWRCMEEVHGVMEMSCRGGAWRCMDVHGGA